LAEGYSCDRNDQESEGFNKVVLAQIYHKLNIFYLLIFFMITILYEWEILYRLLSDLIFVNNNCCLHMDVTINSSHQIQYWYESFRSHFINMGLRLGYRQEELSDIISQFF
jgi:hypothetical protein